MTFSGLQHEFFRDKLSIAAVVRDKEMPVPTCETWLQISHDFYKKTNYPNCVGTLDGKHIRCINMKAGGSNFFNYKKFFSIVLMALVNANLKSVAIDVGACGQGGDSTVFKNSALEKKLYSGSLNLPSLAPLPNTTDSPQPFVFVADEAFKLSTNLMTPFPSRGLTGRRTVYNY